MKNTTAFFEKVKSDTSVKTMPFQHILAKSPDISPMDHRAFGPLKRAVSERKPICKVVEENEYRYLSKFFETLFYKHGNHDADSWSKINVNRQC